MKELEDLMALKKLHKVQQELNKAIELINMGLLRDSKKHIDFVKDGAIGAIHLIDAELEGGE